MSDVIDNADKIKTLRDMIALLSDKDVRNYLYSYGLKGECYDGYSSSLFMNGNTFKDLQVAFEKAIKSIERNSDG